jgi:hypothetical protein
MRESRLLIAQLHEKLSKELRQRRTDLATSQSSVLFMKDEQLSLIFALESIKFELESLHCVVGKSAMRYFVDVKPVHGNVVRDVPEALASYLAQKEEEKARLAAEKAAHVSITAPPTKPAKPLPATAMKRRRTVLPAQSPPSKKSSAKMTIQNRRKSVSVGVASSTSPADELDAEA